MNKKKQPKIKAVITGATSGIGLASAREIIRAYPESVVSLCLIGRRMDRLAGIKNELSDSASISIEAIDVRDKQGILDWVDRSDEYLNDIDVLINNAGLAAGLDTVIDADLNDWEQMIDTNIKGLLYMTKALLPKMTQRGCGHIVNIGSIAGQRAYPKGSVYCATKFAVHSFSESLRMETIGTGVRVSNIAPGMTETEFSLVRFKGDKEQADNVYQNIKPLSADDIASAIVWCLQRPDHVNIQEMLVMPTNQASPYHTFRSID